MIIAVLIFVALGVLLAIRPTSPGRSSGGLVRFAAGCRRAADEHTKPNKR